MHKTLHKKLTGKHPYDNTTALVYNNGDDVFGGLAHEMSLLRSAANDLMQPRPQAVANILKLARNI